MEEGGNGKEEVDGLVHLRGKPKNVTLLPLSNASHTSPHVPEPNMLIRIQMLQYEAMRQRYMEMDR